MLATYHNHSNWSDGKATLPQLLAAARSMRIGELGVSDHWVLHPQGTIYKWAMHPERIADYVEALIELRRESKKQRGPEIRIGLEVDWYPSRPDSPDPGLPLRIILERHPFDYLIGSVHEVDGFMIDGSPGGWAPLSQDRVNDIHRRYWQNMKTLGESDIFDIVAHIDLPKKFGFHPTCDLHKEIGEALDAIAAAPNKPVVELNTAGWHKPCADAYPTLEILRECRRRDIPVTISADAHQPEHLLRDFDKAAARLAEAGYTQVARFAGREKRFESLENAAPRSGVC
jgi:histidinol-phosphatase (PHP family)